MGTQLFWWCSHVTPHLHTIVLKDAWKPNSALASRLYDVPVQEPRTGHWVPLNFFVGKFGKLWAICFSGSYKYFSNYFHFWNSCTTTGTWGGGCFETHRLRTKPILLYFKERNDLSIISRRIGWEIVISFFWICRQLYCVKGQGSSVYLAFHLGKFPPEDFL